MEVDTKTSMEASVVRTGITSKTSATNPAQAVAQEDHR